jgi:hypothetical protein
LPCLGAALLIHANLRQDTVVARVLGWAPFVGVGLISYSFYLWHWPVLVLSRLALDRALNPLETAAAITASFAAAWLSWACVEAPFRKPGAFKLSNSAILAGSAALLSLVAVAGFGVVVSRGAEWRASRAVLEAERAVQSFNPRRDVCHVANNVPSIPPEASCTNAPGSYDVLLWGDSHADHFAPAVDRWARGSGLSMRQASKSRCRPILTAEPVREVGVETRDCIEFNNQVIREVAARRGVRVILLSAWWLPGQGTLHDRLAGTIEELHRVRPEARIVVLGPSPALSFWPAPCLARARFNHVHEERCLSGRARNAHAAALADRLLSRLATEKPEIRYVRVWNHLCRRAICRTVQGRVVLLRDDNHFTVHGAEVVLSPELARLGAELQARRPNPPRGAKRPI